MFSVKFIIREDKNNSVRIRVTNNRKSAQFSIGISATQDELDNVLSNDPKIKLSNVGRMLRAYRAKVDLATEQLIIDGRENDSASTLAEIFKNALIGSGSVESPDEETNKLFIPFFRRCIESKSNAGYRENRTYTLNKVCEYCKDSDHLTFDDIDLKWLNRFDEWLVGQGLKQNTRNIHFKNIRTVINRAIDEELTDKYPFRRFKIKPEATRKRNLPINELRKLFTCEVEEYQIFYRDMAKLMFMLCGINAVDLYNLDRVTSDNRVEYRRAKTHKLYSIKVEPEAMEIIEKYRGQKKLLNIADRWSSHKDFTKWLNSALKKIGEVTRSYRGGKKNIRPFWPDISSYWMRHSWATIAYNECDVSKDVIAQALGHKSGVEVTEIYLDKDRRKIDSANRKVLDFVLYNKPS